MAPEGTRLVVVGQGYVGLPLAMRAVEVGHTVVGIDLDEARVASLNSGHSYVDDVSHATLANALDSGRYEATTDYASAEGFTVAVITVPTPLRDSLPDLSFIELSSAALARTSLGAPRSFWSQRPTQGPQKNCSYRHSSVGQVSSQDTTFSSDTALSGSTLATTSGILRRLPKSCRVSTLRRCRGCASSTTPW